MRKLFGITGILIGLTLLLSGPTQAQTKIEFQTAEGYTDNLFLDAAETEDFYNTTKASITNYPFSFLELTFNNEYTYYSDIYNLSNFKTDIGFTLLPIGDASKFSLYINGNFSTTVYRVTFQHFSNDNYDFGIAMGYPLADLGQVRTGWLYNNAGYTNELPPELVVPPFGDPYLASYGMSADNDNREFFFGFNLALGSNALDFETGIAQKYMTFVQRPEGAIFLNPNRHPLVDGKLKSYYLSPRFSRPIGSKTGINITYTYRKFDNADSIVVPGISTEFLSPWASVYAGEAITVSLKTFLIPNFTTSVGAGYWDKKFLTTEEILDDDDLSTPPAIIKDRRDYQTKYFLSVKRPMRLHSGTTIEPALQIDYSDNNSSNPVFDYTNLSVLIAIKVSL